MTQHARWGASLATVIVGGVLFVPFCIANASYPNDDGLPSYMRETPGLGSTVDPTRGANNGAYNYTYTFAIPPGRSGLTPDLSLNYSSQSHSDHDYFGYGWQLSIPSIQRLNKTGLEDIFATSSTLQTAPFESTGTTTPTDGKLLSGNGDGDHWSGYWSALVASAYSAYDNGSAQSGTWSLLQDTAETNGEPEIYRVFDSALTQGTVTVYVRKDKTNHNVNGIALFNAGNTDAFMGPYVFFRPKASGNGDLGAADGAGESTIGTAVQAANTWYEIKIVFDSVSHTYDVYLDGLKKNTSPLAYRSNISAIDRIKIVSGAASDGGSGSPGSQFWVDNIGISPSTVVTPSLRPSFYSSLSGELVDGPSTNQYYTRNDEGSYLDYTFASSTWTAKDKAGKTYLFGTSTGGRQDDSNDTSKIYKWMLQSVTDANGNSITYTYSKDRNQIYPDSIRYTGNATTSNPFAIDFTRTLRATSTASTTESGFGVKTRYNITQLAAKFNGSTVRTFDLSYGTGDNGTRSVLTGISETGQAEASSTTLTLPSTTFSYSTTSSAWATTTWTQPISNSIVNQGYDRGVTLVDVNGDGLADEIQGHKDWDGSDHYYQKVYINDGSSWDYDASWTVPCQFTYFISNSSNNLLDGGGRIADVNGDALPDFICTSSTYLNTGTNWTASTTWNLPISMLYNGSYDNGARFGDVNGDGLVDIVRSFDTITGGGATHSYSQTVFLNSGEGWATTTAWSIPSTGILFSNSDHGAGARAQLMDINGDGLADLVNDIYVYLNTGSGWSYDATWDLPASVGGMTTRVADVNADNLPDVLVADGYVGPYPNPDVYHWSSNAVHLNTGSGWASSPSRTLPIPFRESTYDTGVRFGDLNGDTIQDLVVDSGGQLAGDYAWSRDAQYVSQDEVPDLLTKVIESGGGTIVPSYQGAAEYRSGSVALNPSLRTNVPVVESVTKKDGVGVDSATTYSYEGGSYYFGGPLDRRFAGFNEVTKTDADDNYVKTYFHQGNTDDGASYETNDTQAKIGKSYRTEAHGSDESLYDVLVSTWNAITRSGRANFVSVATSTSLTYDGDSDHKDVGAEYTYSTSTGNLTRSTAWGEVTASANGSFTDTGSDKRVTDYTYAASSTSPFALAATTTLSNQSGTREAEMRNYYDSLAMGLLTKGNKTKEERWVTGSTYINSQFAFNTFGLVSSSTDPRGKNTAYAYDIYNLYVSTTTNPLSQINVANYDYSSGKVILARDANSLITQTILDPVDRVTSLKQPDLTSTTTQVTRATYTYTDAGLPRKVEQNDYLNAATSTRKITYLDGFGRKVEQRSEANGDNTFAVRNWEYDARGLLSHDTLPYFASSTSYSGLAAVPSVYLTSTYTYDPLGRMLTAANAVGITTSVYEDWNTIQTDANGHNKEYLKDAFGNLSRVTEYVGTSTGTTNYGYTTQNALASSTDSLGNVRSFSYDGLGRRTQATDLHAPTDGTYGTYTWTYDNSGNVTQSVDPKSQTVNYTYDNLNRVLTEDYTGAGGTEITYTYDDCLLGIGRLCTVTTSAASSTLEYNALGLVSTETKAIDSTLFTTTYSFDQLGNQTLITLPGNVQIRYDYNDAGSLGSVYAKPLGLSTFSPIVAKFDYAPTGMVSYKRFGNDVVSTYTYDAANLYRLVRILTYATSSATSSDPGMYLMGGGGGDGEGELSFAGLQKFVLAVLTLPQTLAQMVVGDEATSTPDVEGPSTETVPVEQMGQATSTPEQIVPTVETPVVEETPVVVEKPISTASTTDLSLLPVDAQELQLKTSPTNILGKVTYANGLMKYAYRSDQTVDAIPAKERTTSDAEAAGLQITSEVVDLRTDHARTFATDMPGYYVAEIVAGDPQYYQDEKGEWWQVEYGVTSAASYEYQTAKQTEITSVSDVISYLSKLVKRVVAFIIPRALAQTLTFYPNPASSMDAMTMKDDSTVWSTTHDAGASVYAFDAATHMDIDSTFNIGSIYIIKRTYVLFDTSAIPDGATIASSTLSLYVQGAYTIGADTVAYLVAATPASNTSISTDDFDQLGTTSFGVTDGTYTTSAYENIPLNSSGKAAISTTGITKFGVRTYNDLNNIAPTNASEQAVDFSTSEVAGTSQDPYLTVVYYSPPSAPTALQTEGQTNPTTVVDSTPEFSALYNDIDSVDFANYYQIQVASSTSLFDAPIWDSTKTAIASSTPVGQRVPDVSYAGSALATTSTYLWDVNTYYWRIRLWDADGNQGDWSSPASFKFAVASSSSSDHTTPAIQNMYFTYDAVGNILSVNDYTNAGTGKKLVYTYDELNRLTRASTTAASSTPYLQTFAYNLIGNLTYKSDVGSSTYAGTGYANPHAPTSINGVTQTYDNNGNLTAASPWTYTWDYRNRLTGADNGAASTYTYDYLNQRVKQVSGGITTLYPNNYMTSVVGTGTTTQIYANGEVVGTLDQRVSLGSTTTTHYVHNDQLGGLNVTTSATSSVEEVTDYYPFGAIHTDTTTSYNNPRKFIGQMYDASTQLNYLNARYYEGTRGQFLSEDPSHLAVGNPTQLQQLTGQDQQTYLSDPQQLNSYGYGRDNPITRKDPDGNNPYVIAGAAAFAASVYWDWGTDIYRNVNDSSVPWYGVLSPRGSDAAARYNKDGYANAATAVAVVATEARLSPAVAKGLITEGGAKVLAATAGGIANTANAYFMNGDRDPVSLGANFVSGFAGSRVGQAIPNPRGAPPTTLATSLAGSRAITEQIRAQLGQVVQGLTNLVTSLRQQNSSKNQ